MSNKHKEVVTLVDRIAVAVFSAIVALITGTIVWVFIHALAIRISHLQEFYIPFQSVLVFTAVVALLGFLTKVNLIANIFGIIWGKFDNARKRWM